jgi:hypothetical protein
MLGRSQQMGVIGVHFAEARFGRRGQMDGIGCTQKHGCRQLPVNIPDARENVRALWDPMESAGFDVRLHLTDKRGVGGSSDGPYRAACDGTRQSILPGHGLHMPGGRLRPEREPHRRPDPGNRAGRGSCYRSGSAGFSVPILTDGFGRIGSAAKVPALPKKGSRKRGIGEKRPCREGRRRNNPGNQLSAFGQVNLFSLCLPDPSSGGLMEFADVNVFMCHIVSHWSICGKAPRRTVRTSARSMWKQPIG